MAVKIDLKAAFANKTDMALLAPLRFNKVGSEFHEANLFTVGPICFEPRSGKGRLPLYFIEADLERLHVSVLVPNARFSSLSAETGCSVNSYASLIIPRWPTVFPSHNSQI